MRLRWCSQALAMSSTLQDLPIQNLLCVCLVAIGVACCYKRYMTLTSSGMIVCKMPSLQKLRFTGNCMPYPCSTLCSFTRCMYSIVDFIIGVRCLDRTIMVLWQMFGYCRSGILVLFFGVEDVFLLFVM